ncbi:MAG TPA: HAD-IA family hydrolase [Bacillota bacterium]|nr:HAD-IA family hydrolase [Bacillota bacterium]
MPLEAIFFDLDDTLWDFKGSSEISLDTVFSRYLSERGVDREEWLCCYEAANHALWTAYQAGTHTAAEVKELRFGRSFSSVGVCMSAQAIREVSTYYLSEIVRNTVLYPGVQVALSVLSRRFKLGIISNGMAVSRERLDSHGIGQYFGHIITAANAGAPKPSAEIFTYALAAAGVSPCRAAYVGDDYNSDVLGSKRAGMVSVWYNPSGKTRRSEIAPDYEIKSFRDLEELFVNLRLLSEA